MQETGKDGSPAGVERYFFNRYLEKIGEKTHSSGPCGPYLLISSRCVPHAPLSIAAAKEKKRRRKIYNKELAIKREKELKERYELVQKKLVEEFGNFQHGDLMASLRKLKTAAVHHSNPRDKNQGGGILRSFEEALLKPRAFLAVAKKHFPSLDLSNEELGALSK